MAKKFTCPRCNGWGKEAEQWVTTAPIMEKDEPICAMCLGEGKITSKEYESRLALVVGEEIQDLGVNLRQMGESLMRWKIR